jgi:iron-sulfur cluster assembly protein
MAITLTLAAAERVKNFIASRGKGLGLRLGVRKTGCSGFAYVINYADGRLRETGSQ